jgi:large subunit ribosomal protein L20
MRATNGVARHKKKNRLLKKTKGYWGRRHMLLRLGIEAVKTAGKYATSDRRKRKRDFRRLWITRIGAASRPLGITYSRLIAGLDKAGIEVDRKQLAELAIHEPRAFEAIVEKAKAALPAALKTA